MKTPLRAFAGLAVFSVAFLSAGESAAEGWSVSLYAGPWTDRYTSEIFFHGQVTPIAGLAAIAVDGSLFHIGKNFAFEVEAQYVRHFSGYEDNTFALGIGIRYAIPKREGWMPMSFALYIGPSYSQNPHMRITDHDYAGPGENFLNYLSVEIAIGIPGHDHWDAIGRYFHRSSTFGVYHGHITDEGSGIGLGVRRRF
jgi:hypothetical protein